MSAIDILCNRFFGGVQRAAIILCNIFFVARREQAIIYAIFFCGAQRAADIFCNSFFGGAQRSSRYFHIFENMNVFSFTVKMNLREDHRTGLPLRLI